MVRSRIACLFSLALALACSGSHENPVLPTDPGAGSGVELLTVTVTSELSQLTAGTANGTSLLIAARHSDGTPPADGKEVAVNTNLGAFSFDPAGTPVLLTRAALVGGKATVMFFPGSAAGVANIMAQVGTNIGRLNLPIVAAPPAPAANFTAAVNGLIVLFTDTSTGSPATWRWQFGDGTPDSTERSPSHTYAAPGTYTVTLTAGNAGGSTSKSQFVTTSLGAAPVAAFDVTVAGQQANFVDRSTGNPTSWTWTFGDGGSSTQQNPVHAYPAPGAYTVGLTVRNAAGDNNTSKVVTIAAGAPPQAAFDFLPSGLQVNFVDQSTGNPTAWSWTFGDGGSSTQQNPVHLYAAAGTYTVSLKAKNSSGETTASKIVPVSAGTPPAAKFAFTVNGNQVNFVDQSTGGPTSWAWTFGDGGSDSQPNPVHTYASPGAYTVSLAVANGAGSNSTSQVVTIAAGTAPKADFTSTANGFKVNFLDRSTGNPTSWSWNFGDGTALSTQQNPVHTYAAAGSYTVVLTVTNASGSNNKSNVVTVPSPPAADFTFTTFIFQVTFTDRSTGTPTSWSWNFGDGTAVSNLQNPVHTYTMAGTYTVVLTATNSGGSTNATKSVTVAVP